mmetsp:Transcript_23903/g.60371  ORF Transcript_23903/g.60371 Transcript_23903/m.60371 type:complete len:870 (-) Transcript_23903:69-2678(-)
MLPNEDALTTQSMRIEVMPPPDHGAGPGSGSGPGPSLHAGEMDADAAAGGRKKGVSEQSCGHARRTSAGELQLPIEARGGSAVASAGLAQIERSLSDTHTLQGHAMAAIDRIAKQQAAMRRFPMVCPSCGTLNAPPGLAWGVGDIASCQDCGHSFVPLGHGFDDSDLKVLRTAVLKLREQAERVQYLEQIVNSRASATPSCGSHSAAGGPSGRYRAPSLDFQRPTPGSRSISGSGVLGFEGASPLPQPPARTIPYFGGGGSGSCDSSSAAQPSPSAVSPPPSPPTALARRVTAARAPRSPLGARRAVAATSPPCSPQRLAAGSASQRRDAAAASAAAAASSSVAGGGISSACNGQGARKSSPSPWPLPLPIPSRSDAPITSNGTPSARVDGSRELAFGQASEEQPAQLMSLLQTQDLITNSSCSSTTPCILGRKLRQRQLDTAEVARDAVNHVRSNLSGAAGSSRGKLLHGGGGDGGGSASAFRGRPRGEREDGEITSASDSDSTRSWDFHRQKSCSAVFLSRKTSPVRERGSRDESLSRGHSRGGAGDDGMEGACNDGTTQGLGGLFGDPQRRAAQQLVTLIVGVLLARAMLFYVFEALAAGPIVVPALLSAILTGSTLLSWRTAQQALKVGQTMETETNWGHRSVSLRIGGPTWTLWSFDFTLEEAFGLTCVLGYMAIFCFFENWGLYGPRSCRTLAVVGHASSAAVLTVSAQAFLAQNVRSPETPGDAVGIVWLCLAAGNWATTSWAAMTWWRTAAAGAAAAAAAAAAADARDPSDVATEGFTQTPVLALAGVQLVNFWMARRAQQPVLLSACVVLAGVSMAWSCYLNQDSMASTSMALAPWTPAIYLSFCAMSAWVLWQELIRSL